ncbi:MAG: site-specific integrase, partial [Mediterranea sp.]|nr:site-specific integrase [Mediterranea sp.]
MARKKALYITADELLEGYSLKSQKGEKQLSKAKEYVYLRGKKLNTGNISLFIDFCRDGKRIKQYLGLYLNLELSPIIKAQNEETCRIARTVVAEKNVELQRNENGFVLSNRPKTKLIDYILFQADEALKKSGNPHGYYYTLQALAKHISMYSGDNTTFQHVDDKYVLGFIEYLRTAKNGNYKRTGNKDRDKDVLLGPNTQHNLFKKFAYIIRKAVKADIIAKNPIDKLENTDLPKAHEGRREYLTIEEIKKLIATPCKYDGIKWAFLFACLVGLRYSDLASITWSDLYKGSDGCTLLRLKVVKTKRDETFPVSDEALKWLPEDTGRETIFSLPKNDHANYHLKNWSKAAGITKNVTFHVARHTAATLNLSLGTPIETVSKLLGHTKISTTQI